MFGAPSMKAPPQQPTTPAPPKPDDPNAKKKLADQRSRARMARGYSSTIATSPQGVMGGPMEQDQAKRLFGG